MERGIMLLTKKQSGRAERVHPLTLMYCPDCFSLGNK